MKSSYFASVNGEPVDNPVVSTWDVSFQRGLGIFEVIRVLPGGKLRSPDLHWDRMVASAEAIQALHVLPPKETLLAWAATAAQQNRGAVDEGSIRIIVTLGAENPDNQELSEKAPPNVYIMWQPLPQWPESYSLMPLYAPWHTAGKGGWNGDRPAPKVTSYGPNVLSTRRAKRSGFTDALLLTDAAPALSTVRHATELSRMFVLDGPNFAVGWIGKPAHNGNSDDDSVSSKRTVYFPSSSQLGLLRSTTQLLIMSIIRERHPQWTIEEGTYRLEDMLKTASEVFVMSSTRGVIPVSKVGDADITLGAIVPTLRSELEKHTMEKK